MAQSAQARNEANSIIQKFILGSPDEMAPIPLIVGISATPQRFADLLVAAQKSGKSRTTRTTTIDAADVRTSGLIKDAIQFVHPTERQPSDMTLLRAAVKSWLGYKDHWADYSRGQKEESVNPLLAIQVVDGSGAVLTQTDMAECLACIEAEAGPMPEQALAHAFQDKDAVEIGGRRIRHIPPSEISADAEVQIVFFKTSLTTGWDCPRAEVMMSFRTAADATHIAQLVGRMVRTPLVRRIDADEFLNTVALYLPHYDEAGLKSVIKKLTDPDSEIVPPTEVRTEQAAALQRATDSEEIFAALSALPSYSVPRAPSPNETKRLVKMALRLSMDGLYPNAPDRANEILLEVINAAHRSVQNTAAFHAIVDERDMLDIRLVSYLYGEDAENASQARQIVVSPENIEDLFEAAGRKIGEGLHREWRAKRVEDTGADPRRAKLEFVALATADLKRALDAAAKKQAQTWKTLYQSQISALSESKRQAYDDIQGLASAPELKPIVYPNVIEAKREGNLWSKHLFVDEQDQFQAKFNDWETLVLQAELKQNIRGWLRVVPRKPWALTVPYKTDGKTKPVYIDFLVVREGSQGLVVDIIDPHNPNLGDAADKLAGLAEYAEQHGAKFGRIESIIVENDEIRRLNLQDKAIRDRAKQVRTTANVQRLFADAAVTPITG